jgi:flotillin
MEVIGVLVGVLLVFGLFGVLTFKRLICICQPNEVLIFSGPSRHVAERRVGYKIIIGGRKMRIPRARCGFRSSSGSIAWTSPT